MPSIGLIVELTMPSEVKLICDSINPDGIRLSTFEVSVHLFIWPEILTHRQLSRNAQSNRAIPTRKIIEMVRVDPSIPFHFGRNQPGMVAEEELSPDEIEIVKKRWVDMANQACDNAEQLSEQKAHKQFLNRILGPFQWIRAVISATEWDNFFNLRCHPAAQPEVRIPAERMRAALQSSTPDHLGWGEWHIPFLGAADNLDIDTQLKVSTARTARVSYLSHTGEHSVEKDLGLHDTLMTDCHWSPFEHCAMADEKSSSVSNFHPSWLQYRKLVEASQY